MVAADDLQCDRICRRYRRMLAKAPTMIYPFTWVAIGSTPLLWSLGNHLAWYFTCHRLDREIYNWRIFIGYKTYHRWYDNL